MKKTLSLFICSFLAACGSSKTPDSKTHENPNQLLNLSKEERAIKAPSEPFISIYANDFSTFTDNVNKENFDFKTKNLEGDTALAVSIKLNRPNMTLRLIEKASLEDLKIKNKNGRSFVSLLVEYNQVNEFDNFVSAYSHYGSLVGNATAFNFYKIDFKDDFGKNSTHYARSKALMSRLYNKWFDGALNIDHAWNNFFYGFDNKGNSFLHSAAASQKTQVLSWYTELFCSGKTREENEYRIAYVARRLNDYIADTNLIKRRFINRQNNNGDTALHVAAKLGNNESIRQLFKCAQVDPSILNNQDRPPITELLKSIDPYESKVSENYKKSFNLLYNKTDSIIWFWNPNTFISILTQKENEGEEMSALHYAARLADPYFFNQLEIYAEEPVYNKNNQTPQDLLRSVRR